MRYLVGAGLVLLAALVAVLAAAAPAYAHAQLVGSTPANGALLDTAPAEIGLEFSERVNLVSDGVQMRGPSGVVSGVGPARIDPASSTHVRVDLPALPAGAYTVSWRVVSTDSHPIHGAFVFGVGVTDLGPLPDAGAQTGADATLLAAFWLFRWLGYAALAVLAGGACFLVFCWPAGWALPRVRRSLTAGWAASVVSAVAVLLLQGPYASGGTLARIGDLALLRATMDTDYGRFVVTRLALLGLAGGLLLIVAPAWAAGEEAAAADARRTRTLSWTVAALLAIALPATWVGTGHANGESSLLPALADTAHLSAMAIWFGGLVTLMLCALPRSVARPIPELARALTRFSSIAAVCVGVLVVTGGYQAWRGVGSISALAGSTYGTILVFKLGVVGVLLWLGWLSRTVVRQRYLLAATPAEAVSPAPASGAPAPQGDATAAARRAAHRPEPAVSRSVSRSVSQSASRSARRAERAAQAQEHEARQRLRLSVRAEVAIAATVLALTSMLVSTPPSVRPDPATQVAAPAATPIQLALAAGGVVDVLFEPARPGAHVLTLTVLEPDGDAWDVPEVTAALVLPDQGVGPLPVTLTKIATGEYRASDVTVPLPGTWRLQITVRTSEIDQTTVATDLTVGP